MKFKTSVLKKVYDIVNELGSDVIFDIKNGIATVKMLNHGKTVYVKIDMFMDSEEERVFGIQLSDLKKIVNVFKSSNEVEFKFDRRIEIIGGKKKIKIDELARNEVLSIDIDVVSKMSLKMSKNEIKDEFKQTEGNPEIKSKIRQLQREMAKKRMMSEVPKSDVVITNPTHYAVAIRYDKTKDEAPRVIAKGVDNLALKIKSIARENNVQIVQNPPLARALYTDVEVDKQIPDELFTAVAEVLAFVYKANQKS